MKQVIVLLVVLFLPTSLWAQSNNSTDYAPIDVAVHNSTTEKVIEPSIEKPHAVCGTIKNAKKAMPSAAYVPGVDINGDAVIGADINPPVIIDNVIKIPVEADLLQKLELIDGVKIDPTIADVMIDSNGLVTMNGQDISNSIYNACGISSVQINPVEAPAPVKEMQIKAPAAPSIPSISQSKDAATGFAEQVFGEQAVEEITEKN